jgi:hypothetical protein
MESRPVFAAFLKRRRYLNERLDETRARIDAWFDKHMGTEPEILDLAALEGLLNERRKVFEEFIAAHEAFMEAAIRSRRATA